MKRLCNFLLSMFLVFSIIVPINAVNNSEITKTNEVEETVKTNDDLEIISKDLDLSAYANSLLNVYSNSRVTSILYDEVTNAVTLEGYAFVQNRNFNKKDSLWREVILVNTDNTSDEYAYREQVTSVKKGQFLTNNKILNPNRKYNYDYAMYTVTFDLDDMKKYDNVTREKVKGGEYLVYIRVSDGKNAKLFPLQNVTLNDGSKTDLPNRFVEASDGNGVAVLIDGERAIEKMEEIKPIEPEIEDKNPTKPNGSHNGGSGSSGGGSSGGNGGSGGSSGGSEPEEPDEPILPDEIISDGFLFNFELTEKQYIEIKSKSTTNLDDVKKNIEVLNSEDEKLDYKIIESDANIYKVSFEKNTENENGIFELSINTDELQFNEDNSNASKYLLSWKIEKNESGVTFFDENSLVLSHDEEVSVINSKSSIILKTSETELNVGQKVTFYNRATENPEAYLVNSVISNKEYDVTKIAVDEVIDTVTIRGDFYPKLFEMDEAELTKQIENAFISEFSDANLLEEETTLPFLAKCDFTSFPLKCKLTADIQEVAEGISFTLDADFVVKPYFHADIQDLKLSEILEQNLEFYFAVNVQSDYELSLGGDFDAVGLATQKLLDKKLSSFIDSVRDVIDFYLEDNAPKYLEFVFFDVPYISKGTLKFGGNIEVESSGYLGGSTTMEYRKGMGIFKGLPYEIDGLRIDKFEINQLGMKGASGLYLGIISDFKFELLDKIKMEISAGVGGSLSADAIAVIQTVPIIYKEGRAVFKAEGYCNANGRIIIGGKEYELINNGSSVEKEMDILSGNLIAIQPEKLIITENVTLFPNVQYYAFVKQPHFMAIASNENLRFDPLPNGVKVVNDKIMLEDDAPNEFDITFTYYIQSKLDENKSFAVDYKLHVLNQITANSMQLDANKINDEIIRFTWNGNLFADGIYGLWGWLENDNSQVFESDKAVINKQFSVSENTFDWDISEIPAGKYNIKIAHADSIDNINFSEDFYELVVEVPEREEPVGPVVTFIQYDNKVDMYWDTEIYDENLIEVEHFEDKISSNSTVLSSKLGNEYNGSYQYIIPEEPYGEQKIVVNAYEYTDSIKGKIVFSEEFEFTVEEPSILDAEGNIIFKSNALLEGTKSAWWTKYSQSKETFTPEDVAQLTMLSIDTKGEESECDLAPLQFFTGINNLTIKGDSTVNVKLKNVKYISDLNITYLELDYVTNSDEVLEFADVVQDLRFVVSENLVFGDYSNLNNLKKLYFSDGTSTNGIVNYTVELGDLSILNNLTEVSISNLRVNNIEKLAEIENITYLTLARNCLVSDDLATFANKASEGYLSKLQTIRFSEGSTYVYDTDNQVNDLSAFENLPSLNKIYLVYGSHTDNNNGLSDVWKYNFNQFYLYK